MITGEIFMMTGDARSTQPTGQVFKLIDPSR